MKKLFVTAVFAFVFFCVAFSVSAQSQYVGSYSGVFTLKSCKKDYTSASGIFVLEVRADGSAVGYTWNSFGVSEISGSVSSKGKFIGYQVSDNGTSAKVRGKISHNGNAIAGKVKTVCKFTFFGHKQ